MHRGGGGMHRGGRGGCTEGEGGDARASCASPLGTPLVTKLIIGILLHTKLNKNYVKSLKFRGLLYSQISYMT
jgi:hypothetical protein